MTLNDFFNLLGNNPILVLAYFGLIPLTPLLAGIMGKGEGHLSPWKYLYSTLIYLVAVPGIFAVTLSAYLFLFERRSILQTDVFTQILPVVSMIATFLIIRRQVPLDYVPGFDKIGGLIMMITAALMLMWGLDKTRLLVFSYLPFQYVLLILAGLLLAMRIAWSRMFG